MYEMVVLTFLMIVAIINLVFWGIIYINLSTDVDVLKSKISLLENTIIDIIKDN